MLDSRYPVAYIRRSSADDDNPGDVSRAAQEQAVRDLAHRDGHNGDLRIFDDWNRSADEAKEAKRAAFGQMLAAIEAGHVSVVYAYALDRLYRSMRTFVRLTDAAKARGVRVVTLREGVLGGDGSPMAQAFAQITAVFSELELNTAKARARGAIRARQERGDRMGPAPYGFLHVREDDHIVRVADPERPIEPVLAAYREAGTVLGACRLLRERGIPAPLGGATWGTSTLTRVLEMNAPELLPRRNIRGRRQPANAVLAQLVRCPFCHGLLTPNRIRRQLYCRLGARDRATHPRYVVTERAVMPFIRAEAARLSIPLDAIEMEANIGARRDALEAKLHRAHELYIAGDIDRARYDREAIAVRHDLGNLEAEEIAVALPPEIDFGWEPAKLNAVLRAIFEYVDLDEQMRPVAARWTVPAWRA